MPRRVFAMGRLLELSMWHRRPFMSASDVETISYATRCVLKPLAKAPHSQIIETYWNTAMQQNDYSSIPFEARTKELSKGVCRSNGPVGYYTLKPVPGSRTCQYGYTPFH